MDLRELPLPTISIHRNITTNPDVYYGNIVNISNAANVIADIHVDLFMSIFRGRTDVYARRWEKGDQSGYSPAYAFDWQEFREHKRLGGTLKDFKNKKLIPLTKEVITKHLLGELTIGIYPILAGDTSCFLVADFDGISWLDDGHAYQHECEQVGLSTHLERSRSGMGGHVWLFFEAPYPCYKSRQIALELIRRAFKLSEFDKEVSFDRLFPNQDSVAKDGFGNLIALPLQGSAVKNHNTIFLDPRLDTPYEDQWQFLSTLKRHTHAELATIHLQLFKSSMEIASPSSHDHADELSLVLNNQLILRRRDLNPEVIHFLREKLNFMNAEWLMKRRLGKSVYQVQKYFKLVEEVGDEIHLPRGFLNPFIAFLQERKVPHRLIDHRPTYEQETFSSTIQLRTPQAAVINQVLQHDQGVIVAPSGSGKTIIGLELIARRALPALILVHRKPILDQWVERTQTFLGIPKLKIGRYSGVKKKIGRHITIALLQSLSRKGDLGEFTKQFGTVIVDECHHIPAKTFRQVVAQLNPRFLYGLTATPKRKHNDEQLIFLYIGDIIARMAAPPPSQIPQGTPRVLEIVIQETSLILPFKFTTDNYQLLAKVICFDTARNQQIIKDVTGQLSNNRKILVLSERKDHLDILNLYLKGTCETIVISGDDSVPQRASKLAQIHQGHYQVVLSTGQFFGEGLDVATFDCLLLAFPFAFEGKLIQYLGRLRGSHGTQVILDYRDRQIPFLEKQFKQRQRYYNKLQPKAG